MPIEYKIYGCEFKCGQRRLNGKKAMEKHEEMCWYNPKNKTCLTCKNGELVADSCDHPEMPGCPTEYWEYRECSDFNGAEELYNNAEKLIKNGMEEEHAKKRPLTNCKYWEVSNEV